MKWRHLISSLLLACSLIPKVYSQQPKVIKGVCDLTEYVKSDQFMVRLNGDWEFYWNRILRPADFSKGKLIPDFYGSVPSYWTDYPKDIVRDGRTGYATYRARIILPHGFKAPLGVDMPVFDSSYDLYINGKYCGWNGVVGKSAEEVKPEYRRVFFRFDPGSDTLDIVINVSNYDHRRGGFWLPMKLGTFSKVQKQLANSWAMQWSTMSLLLGFSLFFFFFFLINPRERVMAYFCAATTGLAIRPLFTSHFLIYNIATLSWTWIIRFEYIGLYAVILGWVWFVDELYPSRYFRIFKLVISLFFAADLILTLFLPVRLFSYSTLVIYLSLLILIIYAIGSSIAGIMRKNRIDAAYFLAIILLTIAGIHDIRVSLGKAEGADYVVTYAVVIFIFIQAALLLYKWIMSYYEKEKLQNELEFMNRNLEMIVNERTQELKARNEEIEKQNIRIASQNRQLSETIQVKNKMFSVIAHDLRGPIVNILYMLNLLKEKEYKEQYDTFANSSINYAQMVITLLENMLVWGRGQEEKIKYSPEKLNLADVVLTNLSIYKESADKKEIQINFTQVGSSVAYVDKDLMDIIIRNLLSNALKYTRRGGRISILLKDRSSGEGGIMLKICDNGIGISTEKQKHLFTSAEMSSTPGTENEKGTGLGLKLCSELVTINKGTISVESREGEGTCFSIILPEGPVA